MRVGCSGGRWVFLGLSLRKITNRLGFDTAFRLELARQPALEVNFGEGDAIEESLPWKLACEKATRLKRLKNQFCSCSYIISWSHENLYNKLRRCGSASLAPNVKFKKDHKAGQDDGILHYEGSHHGTWLRVPSL